MRWVAWRRYSDEGAMAFLYIRVGLEGDDDSCLIEEKRAPFGLWEGVGTNRHGLN